MNRVLVTFIIAMSLFAHAPGLMAWSDDVSGVMMPEPRGGGGIPDQEVEAAINPPPETESDNSKVEIEWE